MSGGGSFAGCEDGASVIIPTRERHDLVYEAVHRVWKQSQDVPVPVEIIVVCDGDQDAFDMLYESIWTNVNPVLVQHDGFRPSFLRNVGAGAAHRRDLLFLDDDCFPQDGWLEEHLVHLAPGTITAGRIDYEYRDSDGIDEVDPRATIDDINAWTGNMGVTRHDFYRLGGFDPCFDRPGEMGEAAEFSLRAKSSGREVLYLDDALVYHQGVRNDPDTSVRVQNGDEKRSYFMKRYREHLNQ